MPRSPEQTEHLNEIKERFFSYGMESLSDMEILETILSFAIKTKDVHATAAMLIDKLGSLSSVPDASYYTLEGLKGISSSTAMLLKLLSDLPSIYNDDKYFTKYCAEDGMRIDLSLLPQRFINKFLCKNSESVYALLADERCREVYCGTISKGNISNVYIDVSDLCQLIVNNSARYVVLAHNHPSGTSLPSGSDFETTKLIYKILSDMNVKLLDHFVVANQDCVSMKNMGIISFDEI